MKPEDLVFSIANWIVMAGWLALVLAPLRRELLVLVARIAVAATCAIYVSLMVRGLVFGSGLPEGAGFSSLDGVVALFSARGAVLGGWVHFLAFDLMVASWMTENAPRFHIPHWLLVPLLGLTLMSGPTGLLLFLLVAAALRQRAKTDQPV